MKSLAPALLALTFIASSAFPQGTPAPFVPQQYLTNNGLPNAGGTMCSYLVGTSSPIATYADYLLSTPNPQCVPLNSSGRPVSGIWLDPTKIYRFILKDSSGVTLTTYDGVPGSGSGSGGGGGTLWSLSGTTISNQVATRVCVSTAACTSALALLNLNGASSGSNHLLRIDDSASNPGLDLFGNGSALGSYTANSSGLQLRSADGTSQISVAQGNVTVLNGAAAGGTTLTLKASATQASTNPFQVQTSAGANVAYIDPTGIGSFLGVYASATNTDTIQAPNGGVTGKWLIASDSLFLIAEPQPALSAANQARIYLDSGSMIVNASINGAAYAPFGSGGGGATAFSALTAGTNATAAMVVGTGASLTVSGSGTINATAINTTTVPASAAADMVLITTAAGTGAWSGAVLNTSGLADCDDTGGNHLNYDTTAHTFSCGTSGGTVGSVSFGTITGATNTTAAMVVGSGSSLTVSGSGTINATQINFGAIPVSGSIWKSSGFPPVPVLANAADIVATFSGTCNSATYLAGDGSCQAAGTGFLPLSGGTMSGNITFGATVDVGTSGAPPRNVWAGTSFTSLNTASNTLNIPNGGSLAKNATVGTAGAYVIYQGISPQIDATGLAGAFNFNTSGNLLLNPGGGGYLLTQARLGIGTTSPDAELEVVTTGTTDPRGLVTTSYVNGNFAGTVQMRKARGTESVPLIVSNGDTISSILSSAWNGSAWVYPAYIAVPVTVSGSNIGADIRFATRSVGGALVERLSITSTGHSLFGTTTDNGSGAVVQVNGGISFSGALIPPSGITGGTGTFSCGGSTRLQSITLSAGIVTAVSCL